MHAIINKDAEEMEKKWLKNPRWKGIKRTYKAKDVVRLRGSRQIDHTLARLGAEKLYRLLKDETFIRSLGAETGSQAVQQVQAGLKAIYVSGWQVAGDMNESLETYPDQSLYPVLSVPKLIRRIYKALKRQDEIEFANGKLTRDWYVPIVADAEAGFGGPINTYELIKAMIEEGAAAVHLEDQLSSLKKCGHMGGKVLVPVSEFITKLITARFASDIMGVPIIIIARTDSFTANMVRSDSDAIDAKYLTGKRSPEGYYYYEPSMEQTVERGISFAPYSDMIWCETSMPDLGEAREFAAGIHEKFPGKWLAYNCSPSFNWKMHLDEKKMRTFQEKLAEMGYKFQFVTLAGFHAINASMFELANAYQKEGMKAYSRLQEKEFELEKLGYSAIKHQQFVGTGYFDEIMTAIHGDNISTKALKNSTEEHQFHAKKEKKKTKK